MVLGGLSSYPDLTMDYYTQFIRGKKYIGICVFSVRLLWEGCKCLFYTLGVVLPQVVETTQVSGTGE